MGGLTVPRSIRRWLWLAAVVPFLTAGWIVLRANRAATEAAAQVAAEGHARFDLLPVSRSALSGVEPLPAAPGFHDIAVFDGQTYLSGAEGLAIYERDSGKPSKRRAGMELPSAELGAMTTAALHGSTARELLIATDGAGLLRFDGSHFRQLLPQQRELRYITALLALHTGRVLLGTEAAGVAVYDGESLSPLHPALAHEHITALAGTDQDLWVGTLSRGVWRLHAGQMEQIRDALPDLQVLSLAVAGDRVYVGTPLGVVEFQSGQKMRTLAEGTFARALALDGEILSIGTEDEGVFEIQLTSRGHYPRSDPQITGKPIQRLTILNGIEYGLTANAVYRKSGPRWEVVSNAEQNTLTDRHISALGAGAGGSLWVGYFDRGLDIVSAGGRTLRHLEDDHLFCINRIVTDKARTAVATANGLVMFDGDQPRQTLGRKDGLIADHVTDVAFDKDGLVAATPAGISFVDVHGVHSVYVFQGLVNNHVYTLGLSGGELLAGTLGGVSILKGDVIRANYTTANSGLKHNWITALVRVGDDWFAGTYGAGVLRLDRDGTWHTFPDLREPFVVNPNAMLLANGHVYAGSLDRGLYIYDLSLGRWRNTSAGLPSQNTTALATSGGDLYVGTDNGAVRFEERFLP